MADQVYDKAAMLAAARSMRQLWLAYKDAGFTDEQATRFIEATIKSASAS